MGITAEDVKKLREATGAGMMACKEALHATHGDFEKAIDYLRTKGIASAEKRSGREAREGLVVAFVPPDRTLGVMVEVNCETDFVARTPDFQELAHAVAVHMAGHPADPESPDGDPNVTLRDKIMAVSGKLGEAMSVRKSARFKRAGSSGLIQTYIHPGNRLGVMVDVARANADPAADEAFQAMAKNIAMQVAATNPMAVRREDVAKDTVEKELEIYRSQVRHEKKPEAVIEKIVRGKLEKFYQENVLLEQSYVKDPGKTVQEYIHDTAAAIGGNITVNRFVRFQLGQ